MLYFTEGVPSFFGALNWRL